MERFALHMCFMFVISNLFKIENTMRTPKVLKNVAMLLLPTVEYVLILNQKNPIYGMMKVCGTELA